MLVKEDIVKLVTQLVEQNPLITPLEIMCFIAKDAYTDGFNKGWDEQKLVKEGISNLLKPDS